MTDKDYLDNTKKEFTEADMFCFALDYMDRFQFKLRLNHSLNPLEVDKFLTKNIKKYRRNK